MKSWEDDSPPPNGYKSLLPRSPAPLQNLSPCNYAPHSSRPEGGHVTTLVNRNSRADKTIAPDHKLNRLQNKNSFYPSLSIFLNNNNKNSSINNVHWLYELKLTC